MCHCHAGVRLGSPCFAFSGCRFGRCPLFPDRKRGKTNCQSNWSCLGHKESCVHLMIPRGRDLASSVSQGYCHTPHCTQQSGSSLLHARKEPAGHSSTAPTQVGKGSNKLHVCIPDMRFMEIYRHTRYLRPQHSLQRVSPRGQFILK